ncbi:hypothetical protein NHX12_005952 [Muraenolepis orangiensis]|uniref:Uncharacterized protein n=1 Tax=Muraenolepis orangiensis TaxID=630683 RepID=A0A9Q0DSI2_9TELE|nr:hypothetical protein NHX12_005952 [Muraenolepis orangiensis]
MKDICVLPQWGFSHGGVSPSGVSPGRLPQKRSGQPLVDGRTKYGGLESAVEQKPGSAGPPFSEEDYIKIFTKKRRD